MIHYSWLTVVEQLFYKLIILEKRVVYLTDAEEKQALIINKYKNRE